MSDTPRFLNFLWWNLHNFAHHDPRQYSNRRWPKQAADFEAKRDRILVAFAELFGNSYPELLAVCEITREAAQELASKLPAEYKVAISPRYSRDDGFQVAVFYRSGIGITVEPPILPADVEDVADGTRPMLPVHFTFEEHVVRFVACHWTGFDGESSEDSRERLADVLRRDTHSFLNPDVPKPGQSRHVVVMGDLNEEPMAKVFVRKLIGRRDRESSHDRHWLDEEVRRIRLYNAAWRYLGEQVPHGLAGPRPLGAAGTYFRPSHDWRTFDHVLVSSGLLSETTPYFDEAQTRVTVTSILLDEKGLPRPYSPGSLSGVSDHLPIVGRIVLSES